MARNEDIESLDDIINFASDIGNELTQPGKMVLDGMSYLDKPRGAIAGAIKAFFDNSDIVEGIEKGAEENQSYGELLPKRFRREHPYLSGAAGLAMDVAFDPLWFVTPAKVAGLAKKVGKATGVTEHVVNPIAKAISNSDTGKAIIANAEDAIGVNRLADIDKAYNYGRGQDNLQLMDLDEDLQRIKKISEDSANMLTKYIEAAERPTFNTPRMTDAEIQASIGTGSLARDIVGSKLNRERAVEYLQAHGMDVPDFLMQQQHIDKALKGDKKPVDSYLYRDEVLASISDPNLRAAIEQVGRGIIEENSKLSQKLYGRGLLDDEAMVQFADGSHLRRSFQKYETPEEFLQAVKEHGTPAEYEAVFQDVQKMGEALTGTGPAHKIAQRDFMKRQRLSSETMQKMGLILDPEYRVLDSIGRGSKAIREQDYLSAVAAKWGKDGDEAARLSRDLPKARQYVPIPESKAFGDLAGKWVPKDIYDRVIGRMDLKDRGPFKTYQDLLAHWKVGKLADLDSIARNFWGGIPMANVFGGVPMKDMPMAMTEAANAMRLGRHKSKLYEEFLGSGALDAQYGKAELGDILRGGDSIKNSDSWGTTAKKMYNAAERTGMDAFNWPDKFNRLVVFAYHRKQGKSVEEAGDIARKGLLDYSDTPEWVQQAAKYGVMPFARFPFHAGKATAKAVWNDPASVSKWYKMQNQTDKDEKEMYPEYTQPGNLIPLNEGTRTVDGEEIPVRNNLDVSFIYPFASDVGLGNAISSMYGLIDDGKNGIGQQVIRPGMSPRDKATAFGRYAADQFLPSAVTPSKWEKFYRAATGTPDSMGRQYDLPSAAFHELLGLKNVPLNVDQMYERKMSGYEKQVAQKKSEIARIKRDRTLSEQEMEEQIERYWQEIDRIYDDMDKLDAAYERVQDKR